MGGGSGGVGPEARRRPLFYPPDGRAPSTAARLARISRCASITQCFLMLYQTSAARPVGAVGRAWLVVVGEAAVIATSFPG